MTDLVAAGEQASVAIPENIRDDTHTIFTMPAVIRGNERLERTYEEIVRRFQRDAQGIPLSTSQVLLIERMASIYVTLKHYEDDETLLPRQQSEMHKQYLSANAEFNRLVLNNQEVQRAATLDKIRRAVIDAINRVSDYEARTQMQTFLAEELQKAGL